MDSDDTGTTSVISGDLTAKARIRNAALRLHAEKGVAATSIREVAQAAGVTHGLVVHHFATKAGLHTAVQQYVLELFQRALAAVPDSGSAAETRRARNASVDRMFVEHPAVLDYLRRVLLVPGEVDRDLVTMFARFTLAEVTDLRERNLVSLDNSVYVQAYAALLHEIGPRLLAPLADELWSELVGDDPTPAPALAVRLADKAPEL